jgi:hypothetical protein
MIRTVVIEDEEHSRKMLMGMLRENCRTINVVGECRLCHDRPHSNSRTKTGVGFS